MNERTFFHRLERHHREIIKRHLTDENAIQWKRKAFYVATCIKIRSH